MMQALRRYPLLLVMLALLLGAVVIFPRLFLAYLLTPVAAMLWAGWRVVASVDQRVYWLLLIVLCALLSLRVFASREQEQGTPSHGHSPKRPSRVQRWQELFQAAERSQKGEQALQASLRMLLASTIAQPGVPPTNDLSAALKARRISLPAAVETYLAMETKTASGSALSRIKHRMRRWFWGRRVGDDATIREAIRWMEEMMEIPHDR